MSDWVGTPYKVKMTITIGMDINNKEKHKVIDLVKRNYEADVVIFKDSSLKITVFGEGKYYVGNYYEPDEYDDDLYYDEDDIKQLLIENGYTVIEKSCKYDYDWGRDDY